MWGFEAVKDPKNAIFQAKITKIAITQPFLKLETSDFAQKYMFPSYTSPCIRFWPQKYPSSTFGWWKVPFLDIFGDEMAPKSFKSEHSMWGLEAVKDPKNTIFQAKITKIAITQPFFKLETSDFAQKYIYSSYTSLYIRFWPYKYLTGTFGWLKVPF